MDMIAVLLTFGVYFLLSLAGLLYKENNMPQMANITIKKADGTTDIIYVALTPSSGDRTKAVWRVESMGSVPGNRPLLEISSKASQNGQARIVEGKMSYPETYTDSATGVTAVRLRDVGSFVTTVDQRGTDTTHNEMAAQFGNLICSALVQSIIASGFNAT